ncbi:MAG: AgmX/PglI C-terminal domain-containing protein [Deltaproteobacteria bacterium]|nr:AgmX/PglI C-terminal domain-containing protein [Deltaproteobacteria bacterium]MDQ3298093.1 AgmX/PglI C-terminal domain-containing protein [Myxococcota bacterium]
MTAPASIVALRTALIWHDEVMSDVVVEKPTKITLGKSGKVTFVVPDVGLPAKFAIVRPGNRGYLLTLGTRMRGTICIDGEERDVEDFVQRGEGEAQGGFRATPISGRDWGVIDLDETGTIKLFFQFVPLEEAPQFFTPKVIAGGLAGYLLACASISLLWWNAGHALDEAIFRGCGIATLALFAGSLLWWAFLQDGEQKASMAFSLALHGALLYTTFQLYDGHDPFVWPGPRTVTGNYLVTRNEVDPPAETPKTQTVGEVTKQEAAAKSDTPKAIKTATKGDDGAAGGQGDEERARDQNAKDAPPAAPPVQLFTENNKKVLDNILDRNLSTNLAKFTGIKDDHTTRGTIGFGIGTGTGVGDDLAGKGTKGGSKNTGPGGGGNVAGDFKTGPGKIDTGTERPGGKCVGAGCSGAAPRPVNVAIATGTGDFGGYTEDEINRVVKARAGVFRACYQKELNRSPGIGGKLVIKFKIGADGAVQSASNAGGSTLSNEAVEGCVKSNVMRLKFPPKGAIANVIYPFVFSQGG